jgi:hypothetical protein
MCFRTGWELISAISPDDGLEVSFSRVTEIEETWLPLKILGVASHSYNAFDYLDFSLVRWKFISS